MEGGNFGCSHLKPAPDKITAVLFLRLLFPLLIKSLYMLILAFYHAAELQYKAEFKVESS